MNNSIIITDADVKAIEKAIEIRNRGGYVSGNEITVLYNRVLGKNLTPTNCIGCIRQRILELERVLNGYRQRLKEAEQVATEENKPQDLQPETNNSVPEEKEEKTEIKKKGRPKKK